jgi:hypothetical protein
MTIRYDRRIFHPAYGIGTPSEIAERARAHRAQAPAPANMYEYCRCLGIVRAIDAHLARGTRHYRNRDGRLLETLEEVVRAVIIDDDLQEETQCQ